MGADMESKLIQTRIVLTNINEFYEMRGHFNFYQSSSKQIYMTSSRIVYR